MVAVEAFARGVAYAVGFKGSLPLFHWLNEHIPPVGAVRRTARS